MDDRIFRLKQVIEQVAVTGRTTEFDDKSANTIFPVAISPREGESLRNAVIKEQATKSIEIGLAYGFSTLYICEGLLTNKSKNQTHIAVDPFQNGFKNEGLNLLETAGVRDLVEFYEEESQVVLPRLLSEGRAFDFAFVDGSHFFERVFLDLIYLNRLIEPGKVVFVDDYQLPAIAKAVAFCVNNLGWKFEEISAADTEHQWAVMRLPLILPQRTFRNFIDF